MLNGTHEGTATWKIVEPLACLVELHPHRNDFPQVGGGLKELTDGS
jgi:hypothetical protein